MKKSLENLIKIGLLCASSFAATGCNGDLYVLGSKVERECSMDNRTNYSTNKNNNKYEDRKNEERMEGGVNIISVLF